MTPKFKILLASTSPRRIQLLRNLNLPFEVKTPRIIEPQILSDPRSSVIQNSLLKAQSVLMLGALSGTTHIVFTGVTVINSATGETVSDVAESVVYMKKISDDEISTYVESGEPMDKAGAYGIQAYGSMIIERIEGCYFNVMGLPMSLLHDLFKEFEVNLLYL